MSEREFILVDPRTRDLSIASGEPASGFVIPIDGLEHGEVGSGFESVVFSAILGWEQDDPAPAGRPRGNAYHPLADPWLIAVAAIMWEGLVQGLTWDVTKLAVVRGLTFLRSRGLAPPPVFQDDASSLSDAQFDKKSKIEVQFEWVEISEDGEPLKRFYLSMKREFRMRRSKRKEIVRSKEWQD